MAAVVLADPAKYEGQVIPVIGESITHPEMARTISEVTGKTVRSALSMFTHHTQAHVLLLLNRKPPCCCHDGAAPCAGTTK